LDDPPLGQLQMPALFTADGDHDPGRFLGFENDNYLIGFCSSKVAIDKVITSSLRRFQDGRAPFFGPIFNPVAKLLGNIAQTVARDSLALTIGVEETDTRSGCWKGWIRPLSKMRSKQRYPNFMLFW
jgi:hypothetical protein